MLVEHLNRIYGAVAVFAVMPQGFRLWKSRADQSSAAVPIQVPSIDGESPLVLALKQRVTVSATPAASGAVAGLWETPLGHAIALPIVANGRVVAVAYGENPPDHSDELTRLLDTIAETLVGCVNQRLTDAWTETSPWLNPTGHWRRRSPPRSRWHLIDTPSAGRRPA